MLKNYFKKAFSIIEMSIVLLVIAILVGGISATKSMINKARLANAQSLTQNSIINNLTDDLVIWLETSLDTSFIASEVKNDLSKISVWRDNNKNAVNKNNATQNTSANQPIIVKNAFYDSIPAVRFSGVQLLNYNGTELVRSSYTIFVVEQRRDSAINRYFIGGSSATTNGNLTLGYRTNTTSTQAHWGNDVDATVTGYTSPSPLIHRFYFNNSLGKRYSINGTLLASAPAQLNSLVSYSGARIGSSINSLSYFGDIAEIIIFKRSLKNDEIKSIENYLSSKYGIAIQ